MVQRYYIHPMAFGAVKNPGYGHIEVVKYEEYAALESERDELIELLNFYGIDDLNKAREYYREYNDN